MNMWEEHNVEPVEELLRITSSIYIELMQSKLDRKQFQEFYLDSIILSLISFESLI